MDGTMRHITNTQGSVVCDNQNSLTAGSPGPIVVGDFDLLDKLAHFNRERVPERVVHAKGAGAFGYFEVTHDITRFCKASLFSKVGKKTECFTRFSTVGGEKASADTARDPRGIAIKFKTETGVWDFVGNNTPVFFIRDPIKFPDFIHTQKRHPQTNLHDADMFWDFLSLTPESVHQVTILFSDRGIPDGYRHMNAYYSHTLKLENRNGELFYAKMHFKTDQGIKNLTGPVAETLAGSDPDYATRDLFEAIQRGDNPSWTLYMQIMKFQEAATYKWDVYDVTKVWPHKDYPLMPVGKLVLNRNPTNYHAIVEQSAFCPGNLIPGIQASEDKMLQARIFTYHDAHRHRIGANYEMLPVNQPLCNGKGAYNVRDGPMCFTDNKGGTPNYEPNSEPNTPKDEPSQCPTATPVQGFVKRYVSNHKNDDFAQAGTLFRKVMTEAERRRLVENIVGHLKNAKPTIQKRQLAIFSKADSEYGRRVAEGLGLLLSKNPSRARL